MKKNNQKGFSVIELLLVFGVLAAIGGLGYYAYTSHQKTASQTVSTIKKTTASTSPTTTKSSLPDGWVAYENKDTNVYFAYPKNWAITKPDYVPTGSLLTVRLRTPDFISEDQPAGGTNTTKGASVQLLVSSTSTTDVDTVDHGYEVGRKVSPSTTVDGVKTYEYETDYEGDGPYIVQFVKSGKLYTFSFDGETLGETSSVHYPTFRKLLDTFTFL